MLAEQTIHFIYLCFFPPWLGVKFTAAPGNHFQRVVWGESWSKPHFIQCCWVEHMAKAPPVQPSKHWWDGAHTQEMLPPHPKEHRHALLHDRDSPAGHRGPSELTHHADFQLISLQGFQPHQGTDRAAHQDLVSHVELEDVGKILGIAWGEKTFTSANQHQHLLPHIAHAGMELLGKQHNFLKVQRNNVKLEKQTQTEIQAEGPGRGIGAIPAWIVQVPKSRRTLFQCPTLVPTKPVLHMNSLFLGFSSLILSLCQVRTCFSEWTCFSCCFHFPRKSGMGWGKTHVK